MTKLTFRNAACALAVGLLVVTGCRRPWARQKLAPPPKHVTADPEELADLSEEEYLKRKATIGSRSERLEALNVIDQTGDEEYLPFLLERLEKEEDDLLRVKIIQCLARQQDVRAVVPLRKIARWRTSRVGIEAVVALYELSDDSYVPKLIRIMRQSDIYPQLSGIAHRTLKRLYHVDIPPKPRAWNTYYRSHRLAPYQSLKWYASFRAPLPPTVAGSTQVKPRPKGGPQLPQEETKVRRHIVTVFEFWKPDEP
jgi:hypothetical protein